MARERSVPALRPRKRFGQHFLEPAWIDKLVAALAPQHTDTFLEIGPGRGALTRPLASRCGAVVAVEIDRDLCEVLRRDAPPNVTVVCADFLALPRLPVSSTGPVRVVGNLPYNMASAIVLRLLDWAATDARLVDAHVMLQKEVADRLLAGPGTRAYGALSLAAWAGADRTRVMDLPPGAFRPAPKVHSTVIALRFGPPKVAGKERAQFLSVVRALFTRRRKTLLNALGALVGGDREYAGQLIRSAGLRADLRPEQCPPEALARLAAAVPSGRHPML